MRRWMLSMMVCLGFFVGENKGSLFPSTLEIEVRNALSGAMIEGAAARVLHRAVGITSEGEERLAALDSCPVLGSATSGGDGIARPSIKAEGPIWIAIEVSAEGYQTTTEHLARLDPLLPLPLTIALAPETLSEAQRVMLAAMEEEERRAEQVEAQWIVPHHEGGDLRAFATTVPDEVRVVDLNGFTGMMNFDEFIAGVVTRELGDSFPAEALKAQAVASRSFALEQHIRLGRANGGQAYTSAVGSGSRNATLATSKTIMTYNGSVIRAYFSARCNGDFTLNSEEGPTLANCRVGGLGAGVVPFARARACSGHVSCRQTSETCCILEVRGTTNAIYGHGVGMCQRGAQQFASRDGWKYDRILQQFYTGIEIQTPEPPIPLPIVETLPALTSQLSATNAVVRGRVVDRGNSDIIDWRFDWGAAVPLTEAIFKESLTVSGDEFSAALSGLQPDTAYFYRAWARNRSELSTNGLPAGWARGEILTFRTPALPAEPARFTSVRLNGGEMGITVAGAGTVLIESSPDLEAWTPHSTNRVEAGAEWTVQIPASEERQFFRARTVD